MKKTVLVSVILVFLFALTACAQVSIKAEVNKSKVTLDDILTYKLTITSELKNMPKPQLPDFSGFSVISQAQSSNISFEKAKFGIQLEYIYILRPVGTGKFTIGPSSIKIKGDTYYTDSFEIDVTQARGKLKPELDKGAPLPKQPPTPYSDQPKVTL